MKRCFLLFILILSYMRASFAQSLMGDVNGDNKVDYIDVSEISNYIMGKPSNIFDETKADINGDTKVNSADMVMMINMVMTDNPYKSVSNNFVRTFFERIKKMPWELVMKEQGKLNAIKKAYQLTDLQFIPKDQIELNKTSLLPDKTYKGMIYSSVKEVETFVGSNVSFHTFMTAINNPRSKIYTEKINASPYHGINCKAYYGTVCSTLVSYALGLSSPRYSSFDFKQSEMMELIDDTNPENLNVADVLWKKGHVAIITDIVKGDDGIVEKIEISEAMSPRCRRYYVNRESFIETVMSNFQRIYRYKEIGSNYDYTPIKEFVAVEGEVKLPFVYNNDICVDKGDCSNYLENEEVILNILNADARTIEVYKDDILFFRLKVDNRLDYPLNDLTYGNYKARVIIDENKEIFSDFVYWKVVHADIKYDKTKSLFYFRSNNAIPVYVISCKLDGTCSPISEGMNHIFTKEELSQGYIVVPYASLSSSYPYLKVFFKTEYGSIIQKPISWE